MDYIHVEGISCYAYHGVLPEEKTLGQNFLVTLDLGVDLSNHKIDQIEQATDYREAVTIVENVMSGQPCQLLETLACRIADQLLTLPGVLTASVKVHKTNPPIPGVQNGISVVVNRRKD